MNLLFFLNKEYKLIYLMSSMINYERTEKYTQYTSLNIRIYHSIILRYFNYVIAALPYSNAVKTSLIETLKSVTSNVSSTVEDQVNKMISDTMDITISDAMGKLENATIYGNRDTSTIKFEPKVPTGIDISNR
jgi:hypothetical protein